MYANGQGVSQNHTEALRWFGGKLLIKVMPMPN